MKRRVLFTAAALTIGLSGCGASEDPLADGVLTIGLEADYAPYNWTTTEANGSDYAMELSGTSAYVDGYDIRVGEEIADQLGVDLEVKKISWDGLIPALQSGQIDAIVAGMSPTDKRKEQINFTDAYYEDQTEQAVIVRNDSEYANATTLDDLAGANLTAQLGTFQVDLLDQVDLADDASDPLPDYASLLQATTAGTIDGYVVEQDVADAQVAANDNLVKLDLTDGFVMSEDQISSAIGTRKEDEELTNEINEALATIDTDTRNEWMDEAKNLSDTE